MSSMRVAFAEIRDVSREMQPGHHGVGSCPLAPSTVVAQAPERLFGPKEKVT